MKISVCIPTYNRASFLKEAIESCLNQTHQPDEIIIGDDSKNNESEEMIKQFSSPLIRYRHHDFPKGQADNVSSLIDRTTCELFVLLHDDDLLMPDCLKTLYENLQRSGADAVFGKQYVIAETGEIDYNESRILNDYYYRKDGINDSNLAPIDAAIMQQFPNDGFMIKSDLVRKVRYGTKESAGDAVDFDFAVRLALAGCRFYFINEYLVKYRLTSQSVLRSGGDTSYFCFKILNNLSYQPTSSIDFKTLKLKSKAPGAIMQALKKGDKKEAFKIYFSKYHFGKIFTPGGIRRFVNLFLPQ